MQFISSARRLAVACGLLWAAASIGCGGGSSANSNAPVAVNPSPAAAPAAAPAATAGGSEEATMPSDADALSGETASSDPSMDAPMDAPMESAYDPNAGMSPGYDPNMSMSGSSGMGMEGMSGMGLGGMGMNGMSGRPALIDPAPSEDDDYLTKAKYAFAIGKESVAEQYFIAQILTHDEAAPDLLKQVRWSPGARRPASVVRFAVGIDLEAPATASNLQPIGRLQAGNNQGGGSGAEYGMEGGSGGAPAGQNSGGRTLGDITGNFGQELITAFETQWNNGDFGTVFKEVDTIVPTVRPKPGAQYAMGGSSYDPSMGSSMMGNEGSSGMMSPEGMSASAPAAADAALRLKATPGKNIVPGLTYLGTGTQAELATKAQEQGIDYLFLFDVKVKVVRMISNDTRLRLVNVNDGSSIMTTSMLNNYKVEREMAMKGESDIVAKEVAKIFRKVEPFKLADLPKLEPAHAQARVKSLIEKNPKIPLPILLEVRLFNSLGLLDDEQRDAAYQLVLGGSGIAFISGTLEDRDAVLKPLLEPYK